MQKALFNELRAVPSADGTSRSSLCKEGGTREQSKNREIQVKSA